MLGICGRLGYVRGTSGAAVGVGAALVARHQDEPGVQLLGAAASLREELGVGFDNELEDEAHEKALADAKAELGEEAFSAAWARGTAMTPNEIVAFTMST
jgi:hypothetical protein